MQIKEACRFLEDITGTPCALFVNREQLQEFCQKHFFHTVQKIFTMQYLGTLISELQMNTINHTQDVLLINIILIKTEEGIIITGPYVTNDLTEANIRLLAQQNQISDLSVRDYRAYRSNYQIQKHEDMVHNCHILLTHTGFDVSLFRYHSVKDNSEPVKGWEYSKTHFENLVSERYRIEEKFMDQVYEGDTAGAVASYRQLHNNVRFMRNVGALLEESWVSSGITRSTVRIAAMKAGLPPLLIDEISGTSSRIIRHCSSRDEMYKENERMIRAFTQAISRFRKEKYSPIVLNAIYIIEKDYRDNISVEETADRLGVCVSSYINRFKKETGMTPNQFLCDYRIQKAKRLLRTTQHTVQQIADEVGIPDANYFVKCFRKITGVTPTVYRSEFYSKQADKN